MTTLISLKTRRRHGARLVKTESEGRMFIVGEDAKTVRHALHNAIAFQRSLRMKFTNKRTGEPKPGSDGVVEHATRQISLFQGVLMRKYGAGEIESDDWSRKFFGD